MSFPKFHSIKKTSFPSIPSASSYLDFVQNRKGKLPLNTSPKKLFDTADEKMMRIQDIIWQIADTQVPVLITGESGVGKEIVAKAIHEASGNDKPFVGINCSAVPAQLLESELFGFEKGAFTGAHHTHVGKFESAEGGTLLLDEITEMELPLQAKLLRVLQEKEIQRVGGRENIPLKARIIATSNKSLLEAVKDGSFRQDLYYRLYVLHLDVPPLRQRPKDILLLSEKFLKDMSEGGDRTMALSEKAKKALLEYSWPGNVRELLNVLQRAYLLAENEMIEENHLPLGEQEKEKQETWISSLPVGRPMRIIETHFILETLKHHQGNRTHAAKTLGISLRTLRNKINEFHTMGIEVIPPQHGRHS